LNELGGIDAVLGASAGRLSRVQGIGLKTAESVARGRENADVPRELELAARAGVRILCLADDEYPVLLKRIPDAPPCLYVRGELEPADAVALAVVGSRSCTRYGAEQSERFAALMAGTGLTIVSGMARGIDEGAHRGALAARGRTIAVMGCGLSYIYPPESVELADRICAAGAIVSELPMQVAPDAHNFPPRNRIIIGLSLGVLVVEAAERSGAMITARLAIDYNREVFAIPGQIDRVTSAGCHELIKTGSARLVTDLSDILSELGEAGRALAGETQDTSVGQAKMTPSAASLDADEQRLIAAMGDEPASIDLLCDESGLPPARIAAMLTSLQLRGIIRRVPGDLFVRVLES
jgi:DNA processing protein